ncbi:hypothetical protein [Ornithinimicrobium tianjinense]|uniref:Uncharacterized protein n=1 Tax=Ornithinimicrobium tianjinense TaxID=1195761 RepID=A0A917FA23_9MICO|nr:hypothetical protein [Ornithinimicrobium tianjinense]GGF58920.1 hypothetical protein GCM10011366_28440 [Ornithinimicrobium tianjinense]
MSNEPDPLSVTTMAELRAFLVALGRSPEDVGYADDRNQRRGTGERLLSRASDGGWTVASYDRDTVYNPRWFATEREAVQQLAAESLSLARRRVRLTEAEAAELDATREARLQAVLERSRRAREARGEV